MPKVTIYCDGGCRGNPGSGAWAAILQHEKTGNVLEIAASEVNTTNNRMELTAAIEALKTLKDGCDIICYSDSQYVVKGITEWIHGWLKRGWKKADKKAVENKALWQALYALSQKHHIRWQWVKGHAGNEGNERCDALLNEMMDAAERTGTPARHRVRQDACEKI